MSFSIPPPRPRHGFVSREHQQNNGYFIPQTAFYVFSGTVESVVGGTTGSVTLSFGAYGFKLRRFEAFHSGSAGSFDVTLENSYPNTGSFYDPRSLVVDYLGVTGSVNYGSGVDQVEDLVSITDGNNSIYLKFKPYGAGNNWFKYLLYLEPVFVYV